MPECHRPRTRHAGPPNSSFRRRPESRGAGGTQDRRQSWYESMSRDYDPGCALQSTSMTALHRRNLPNCRPMAEGGMRKCSAGACPPLGLGVGRGRIRRANSLYQTTTPAFHTSVCRHQPAPAIRTKMMATQPQKCLNATAPALVMPAPQSSFPRRACPVPRYGAGIQRGGGRQDRRQSWYESMYRDYDPGCALQSTSMPALRRRNLPNCRPMADGGMRKM